MTGGSCYWFYWHLRVSGMAKQEKKSGDIKDELCDMAVL